MATRLLPCAVSSTVPRASAHGRSRRWKQTALWLFLLLVVCAIVWLIFDWIYTVPGLEAMRRVQPGMTEAEVVAVFGAKPTHDTPFQFDFPRRPLPPNYAPGTDRYWYCDAGIVAVNFGPDGRVRYSRFLSYGFKPNPNMLKLRQFLRQIGLGWLPI